MCLGVGGCAHACVTKRNPLQIGIQKINMFYCFHFINSYPVLTDGMSVNELGHTKMYNLACLPGESSDQLAHQLSLISLWCRMKNHCDLGYR